jgi:hypothetical protein
MRTYLNLNILVIALTVISCGNKTDTYTLKEFPVKFIDKGKKEKLSVIVSTTSYLQLETKPDFIVGPIQKAEILDKIYCMQSNKINVFDKNGKALYEINHFGEKSPSGYMQLSTFQVDTINSMIEIWDRILEKLSDLTAKMGNLLTLNALMSLVGFLSRIIYRTIFFILLT